MPPHIPSTPAPAPAAHEATAPRARARRTLRTTVLAVGMLVGAVALGELSGWPFLRAPLQRQINSLTTVPVALDGRFRARFIFSPHLAVEDITVGAGGGVDVPHLLKAHDFDLHWRWSDLWRASQGGALRLASLEAATIDAHAVRLKSGAASWDVVPQNAEKSPPESEPNPLPQIDRLVLRDGDIGFKDAVLDVDLQAHVQQDAQAHPGLPWQGEAKGKYRGAAVQLKVEAGADLPLLIDTSRSQPLTPLHAKGTIGSTQFDFEGAAGALWAGQGVDGQLKISGRSLQTSAEPLGVTLPETPPYSVDAHIVRQGAKWFIVTDSTKVGSSALTAQLQFDTGATPPRLSGALGGKRLALADLAPSIGADKPPRRSGRVLPDEPFDLPSLDRMDANVVFDLDQLDFGTPNLAPVQDLKGHLVLAGSLLTLSDLSARVAGGRLSGSTALSAKADTPLWHAALKFEGVDLDTWVRGLSKGEAKDKTGATPNAQSYMSGTLNASISLKGQGRSVADLLGSANGQLRVRVSDGQLSQLITEAAGLDVAQALGMLIKGDAPLKLRCAAIDAVVQDGVVKTRHGVLDNADSTLLLQGGVSLKDEALHLRVVSKPKDFSPLSLRTPVTVTGPLGQPNVGIEAKGLIARAIGALALGALAPPAALLAFMDVGNPEEAAPCAQVLTSPKGKTP